MLFSLMAVLLLRLEHSVGAGSMLELITAVWLHWVMMLTAIANSWWGTAEMLSIVGPQAGATGAAPWQEALIKASHIGPSIVLLVAWALLLLGFFRKRARD